MSSNPKVAVIMDLEWPLKRHYEILAGIQKYAKEFTNWELVVDKYPELQLEAGGHFDGIIGRITEACYEGASERGIPVINVKLRSPLESKVPSICANFRIAGRMAAEHLIARGIHRLVHFGFSDDLSSDEHYQGMCEIAHEQGYPCSSHHVGRWYSDNAKNWEQFTNMVNQAQEHWPPPIGIAAPCDILCRNLAGICEARNWIIPEQLALVGTNNDLLICNGIEPSISSIDLSFHEVGYRAADLMCRLLNGEKLTSKTRFVQPSELVVRRSSDVFAVTDAHVTRALRVMADHVGDSLSVTDVAKAAGIGRQSLERRFRQHLGRTINEEMIRLKISKLKRLLLEGDQSIKELSSEAGFGTTVSMHTMFKRHTGMTPHEFRKEHQPKASINSIADAAQAIADLSI
jgi:LacI family transcriptional regulator